MLNTHSFSLEYLFSFEISSIENHSYQLLIVKTINQKMINVIAIKMCFFLWRRLKK